MVASICCCDMLSWQMLTWWLCSRGEEKTRPAEAVSCNQSDTVCYAIQHAGGIDAAICLGESYSNEHMELWSC